MKAPVMPHDLDAERAVLAAALLDRESFLTAADLLNSNSFYLEPHRTIWAASLAALRAHDHVDALVLRSVLTGARKLTDPVQAALDQLARIIPLPRTVAVQAQRVHDLAVARDVLAACLETVGSGSTIEDPREWLERAEQRVTQAAAARSMVAAGSDASDAAHRALQAVQERAKHGRPRGHSTGLQALDARLGGLAPGRLYVLAAATSMGKSGLAMCIARSVAGDGLPVAVFSLEMGEGELFDRLAAAESGVPFEAIQTGRLGDGAPEVVAAFAQLSQLPLHVVDVASQSVRDVRAAARRYRRRMGGLGLIVVDYLQLLRPLDPKESRERQVAEVSRSCKVLAGELQAPVLLLSQLNRDLHKRTDKRPVLSDLRESGAIEQDADVVMFLHRDEVYDPDTTRRGIAEVIVAKNRAGACGKAELHFKPELLRFANLDQDHLPQPPAPAPRQFRFDRRRP